MQPLPMEFWEYVLQFSVLYLPALALGLYIRAKGESPHKNNDNDKGK